jgi:hypothetical protein
VLLTEVDAAAKAEQEEEMHPAMLRSMGCRGCLIKGEEEK